MRLVYNALLWLLLPLIVVRLAYRGLRNRAYWQRIPERFGFVQRLSDTTVIWIHAVSVGEARAAAPLVRALADRYPDARLLVTTMTPTGSATVTSLFADWMEARAARQGGRGGGFADRVAHCYVPYDYPFAVRRFLRRTRPRAALIMETELWPNLFRACHARGIPLLVSNARLSEGSMRRYLRVASLARATLRQVRVVAAQSAADARRFEAIGADPARIAVTGSIKFELALPASLFELAQVLRADWGRERPVWIAASTHEGEEEYVLAAFKTLQRRWPTLLLVLVPRHPERFAPVVKLARRYGFKVAQRSQQAAVLEPSVEVLIGDTMGELQLFFAACDVAFVGGSLVATGGHNLLEPAAVGVPTVFGPHMFNFAEIAALTLERRAGRQVGAPGELAEAVAHYLENPNARFEAGEAGRKLVEENRGALERTLKLLAPLL